MILGLGSDICDIRRIEAAIEQYGDRFAHRIFIETERAKALRRIGRIRAAILAKRFAAKEAASKALSTGFRKGVFSPIPGRSTFRADSRHFTGPVGRRCGRGRLRHPERSLRWR